MIPMERFAIVVAINSKIVSYGTWGSNSFFYDNAFPMTTVLKSQIVRNFSGLNLCVRDAL